MNAQLNARIQIKIDTENAWNLVSTTFVPLSGEMCIYRMNDGSIRSKIGDGTTSVGSLDFVDDGIRTLVDSLEGAVSAIQASLDLKAPLNNANLTGTPTAPTASAGTNNTQIATTQFVQTALASAGGGTTIVVSASDPGVSTGDLWYRII